MSENPSKPNEVAEPPFAGAATCACWNCRKDLLGQSYTVMLDGSMLCDRCKWKLRQRPNDKGQR